ncbi:hypothetical protein [Acidovorax sp. LjRoot194]|uniref:hypothetical protein n=1 Tax=Acidovorax sp. LjRoot194 TaxID=3342280 RepID=UPI003ECD6235
MQSHSINPVHLRESMVGEEDPGAALDVVASMLRKSARDEAGAGSKGRTSTPEVDARIHLSCSDDGKNIDVGVTWPHHPSSDVAKLLGLVVANHSAIADTAWSLSGATGLSCIELEVDEDIDGVFYVSRRDC